jgi:hypothetical protein
MDDIVKTKSKTAGANPVVTEIVRNGLVAVTEEMKINLMRTAYNMIIYEASFTVRLFDARQHRIVGSTTDVHSRQVDEEAACFGAENIDPGDILLTNDAYLARISTTTFSVPIFHEGELVAFSCCMAHWRTSAARWRRPISSEGLQMIVKIHRKGVPNERSTDQDERSFTRRAMGDLPTRRGKNAVDAAETAATPCWAASRPSWTRAKRWRARGCARSPTASTRRSPSWTTTASTSASACRSRCGSKCPATA